MEKKVLGRGLDALIRKKEEIIAPGVVDQEFMHVPLNQIRTGEYQPRTHMDQQELLELQRSIKEKGFIQPIVIRKIDDSLFEVVAGGRRFEAAKALGLEQIPALVKELDDKDTLIFAIAENLQRKNLNPIEEALAFKRLMDEFSFSLDDVARFIGKDKTTISNTMRLLKLPMHIKQAVQEGRITRSQARTIVAMEDVTAQEHLFHSIVHEQLSVREIEQRVKRTTMKQQKTDPFTAELEDTLQRLLGTKVRIINKRDNRGKVMIEYYSIQDLERIVRRVGVV